MPKSWAFVSLEPAFSTTINKSVCLETELATVAPCDSSHADVSRLENRDNAPVNTIFLPVD